MLKASSKVRRLEKEAILRAKEYEFTREASDRLLSSLNLDPDEEDNERHRRQVTTRPIRRIQKDLDYPVETMDKITERIQQEVKKRQAATSASASSTTTGRGNRTSLLTQSADERTNRDSATARKVSDGKQAASSKSR